MFTQKLVVEAQILRLNVTEPDQVLDKLAAALGTTSREGYLLVPKDKGKGYLKTLDLGNSLGMMIRDCEFNAMLQINRNFNHHPYDMILLSFNNIFHSSSAGTSETCVQNLPTVQIGNLKLNLEMFYPSHTKFSSIVLTIYASDLAVLLGNHVENSILKSILDNELPVLFEEIITPNIHKIALEITGSNIPPTLQTLYYRLKAQELICLVFAELLKRERMPMQAVNEIDAEKVYMVRALVLTNLSTPPVLQDLSREAGMSRSKLNRLFKQIFGESIFNYYQSFRMKEAARLLKERKLSVSQVGYALGFSNLGHFTRVFEDHIGMKPKKYSVQPRSGSNQTEIG
jgi:AraC-like DNA-binding protein